MKRKPPNPVADQSYFIFYECFVQLCIEQFIKALLALHKENVIATVGGFCLGSFRMSHRVLPYHLFFRFTSFSCNAIE
jgi:hypothetical protein